MVAAESCDTPTPARLSSLPSTFTEGKRARLSKGRYGRHGPAAAR